MQKVLQELRKNKLLVTPQRKHILQELFGTGDHLDADELCDRLRKKGKAVSRATVYRTIHYLRKCGVVREVLRCQGRAKYERTGGHHDHMLCVRCGKIIGFRDKAIERLQRQACRKHGFKAVEHRMLIKGICRECRKETMGDSDDHLN
jgi:Fur family ferric uptake transcriptional regulator